MLQIIIISFVVVGFSILAMAITILIKKNGKFPSIHIGGNVEMKKRGIHCASTTDRIQRRDYHPIDMDKI